MTRDWRWRRPPFAFRWFLPGFELALSVTLVLHWMISVFLPGAWISKIQLIVPALLNFPAALLGLARSEVVPRGMPPELWRSVTMPIVGTVFWWIVGRAWEALAAARKRSLLPALTWMDLLVGTLLMILFGGFGFGLIVSSDREGTIYPWQWRAAVCLLWGTLGLSIVAARLLQGSLRKQMREASGSVRPEA